MPAIRLADIPNAGPQGVAPDSGILAPRVAQLGGAAALDPNAMRGVAKDMQLQTYNLNAFAGEAIGLGRIGDAMGDAATLGIRFATKMAEAKDTGDKSRAETIMRIALEQQANDQDTTPVEKWQEKWASNVAETRKQISEIGMSKNAFAELSPTMERWAELTSVKVEGLANQKRIKGWEQDIEANVLMKVADEDYEGAFSKIDEAVDRGIYTKPQADLKKGMLADNIQRKAKLENAANIEAQITRDPIKLEQAFASGLKTGKVEGFEQIKDMSEIVKYHDSARAEAARFRIGAEDHAIDEILKGYIKNEDELRNLVKGVLPENKIPNLLKALSESPVQREKALAMRPLAHALATGYMKSEDDENLTKYFSIRDTIFQLPASEREEPLALLRKARDEGGESTPLKIAVTTMTKMFEDGQFGTWVKGEDKNPANDKEWDKYIEAGKKFAGHKSALEQWANKNPKESGDPNKVFEQLNQHLEYERKLNKYREEKERWRWPWEASPSLVVPVPKYKFSPDEALKKIKAKSSLDKKSSKQEINDAARSIDFETPLPEMPS